MHNKLFGIHIEKQTKEEVLEKIKKNIKTPVNFFHITSLNPENVVIAQEDATFKKVIETSQVKIVDGTGVVIAGRFLGVALGPRITGVDLMTDILCMADEERLRVMLIGGGSKVAERVIGCQSQIFPRIDFFSLEGIVDIKNPKKEEEEGIFSIVAARKPHLLFVAFGSPFQELWLYKNRHKLDSIVCMGVGGAFDFLSGAIPRAPYLIQMMGLEWFFRLLKQPWRFKRQTRLIQFIALVFREKLR